MRCTGEYLYGRNRNHTIPSLLHFVGKGKSSLTNVKIHAVFPEGNSSLSRFSRSRAIFCDGGCPYVANLSINSFAMGFEIRNYGDIFLSNVKIMDCLYGIVELNEVNSSGISVLLNSSRDTDMFRLETITINNSRVGVYLNSNSPFPIQLQGLVITHCSHGIHISKTIFTKVRMLDLLLDTGYNAISLVKKAGYFEHLDLCDHNFKHYNGSFPVEIAYIGNTYRNPCFMVS